jgi:hypothetical protein
LHDFPFRFRFNSTRILSSSDNLLATRVREEIFRLYMRVKKLDTTSLNRVLMK